MYFVWINGLRGPEAQIWVNDSVDGLDKSKPTLLKVKLNIIDSLLSLDMLKEKYSYAPN